jgi:cysteine desulfurase
MIYLDYAANTPVDEEVLNTFNNATRKYIANPNSSHPLGKLAKEAIDSSSKTIADFFHTDPTNIIYTSGSSESNNLVLKGIAEMNKSKGNKIIISAVEHSSIVAPCNYLATHGYDVSVIPLTKEGVLDLEELKNEVDDKTILVSICAVDSELGTRQPLNDVVRIVKEKNPNTIIHTDATQAIGKTEVNYDGIDFITFAPHKFFGLNGFGVLVNVNNHKLTPLIHGGKSTTIYRSGTPVTANVIALAKAFEIATTKLAERDIYLKELNTILRNELGRLSCVHINSPITSIPNTLNISLINKDTKDILRQLEEHEIYLSTTTACALGSAPSKSVLAITGSEELASNTIRISISHLTTKEDILEFINIFKKLVGE